MFETEGRNYLFPYIMKKKELLILGSTLIFKPGYRDQSYRRRHTVTAAVLRSAIKESVNSL